MTLGRTPGSILASATFGLALVAFASSAARAGERLQFKNGHTLTVEESREDGDWLIVKMGDGSEARFPKALVKQVDAGHQASRGGDNQPSNYAGRSPRFDQLHGYKESLRANANTDAGTAAMVRAGQLTEQTNSANAGQAVTVGFSYMGSGDYGKLGAKAAPTIDVRSRGIRRSAMIPGSPDYIAAGAPVVDTSNNSFNPRIAPTKGKRGGGEPQ